CAALDAYLKQREDIGPEDPLFVTTGRRRITHRAVTKAVKRVARRHGHNLHPHMFRHSYATELLERGADIRDIRDLLGHESVATTEIYTHVSAARQRRVAQLLEKTTVKAEENEPGAVRSRYDPRPKSTHITQHA